MKRKLLIIVLTFGMLISLIPTLPSLAASTINIGDYIQMGKYYNETILWRCVDIDENGSLMLADRILTIKPFDGVGRHKYADGTPQADSNWCRTTAGSNLWETSSMRCWLNSTAAVTWIDGCPPIDLTVSIWMSYNGYATETGFLAERNFTTSERNAIKSVTQKSLLNGIDVPKLSIGGTAIHALDGSISTVVQNYDTSYYHNVTDKMFLLDVKQLNKVYLNSGILGTNYWIGKPTQKSIDNNHYKSMTSSDYWSNWLRTPHADADNPSIVRVVRPVGNIYKGSADDYDYIFVFTEGFVGGTRAYDDSYNINGVRPAFYIDLSSAIFTSGNGSVGTPYVVDKNNTSTPTNTPTCTPTSTDTPVPTPTNSPTATPTATATPTIAAPTTPPIVITKLTFQEVKFDTKGKYLHKGENYSKVGNVIIEGDKDVKCASVETDQNETYIKLIFNQSGAQKFSEATGRLVASNGQIGIFMGEDLILAAGVNAQITDGSLIIAGGFDAVSAADLVDKINSGILPFTKILVTGVKLNKTSLTLGKGKTYKMTATVNPSNASNKKVTWKSGNTKIASVSSSGTIKGIKKGTTYIYVYTTDGKKSAKCKVTVK